MTRTVGLPGSGISHTKTISGGVSRRAATQQQQQQQPMKPVKPGLMAPKWEKELHKAITQQQYQELPRIAGAYPEAAGVASTLDGLVAMQAGETARALEACRWAWSIGGDVADHPFVRKYISRTTVTIAVASGVEAAVPFGRDALGLALAELEQGAGNLDEAIAVVEALDPSAVAAVSLCELYLEAGRDNDVVDLTNGITNADDPTALLVTFRGIALREQGHRVAAREAFKEALKSKSRDSAIRHKALVERAETYVEENKIAMARKDLERVLAEDATVPGVRERLADLSQP